MRRPGAAASGGCFGTGKCLGAGAGESCPGREGGLQSRQRVKGLAGKEPEPQRQPPLVRLPPSRGAGPALAAARGCCSLLVFLFIYFFVSLPEPAPCGLTPDAPLPLLGGFSSVAQTRQRPSVAAVYNSRAPSPVCHPAARTHAHPQALLHAPRRHQLAALPGSMQFVRRRSKSSKL